jgi:hypothetical protein
MSHHIQMPPMLPYMPTVKTEETQRRQDARRLRQRDGAKASEELDDGDATSSLGDVLDAVAVGLGGRSRSGGRGAGSSPRKGGPANKLLSDETLKTVLAAQELE